jgi:hypothetical protein
MFNKRKSSKRKQRDDEQDEDGNMSRQNKKPRTDLQDSYQARNPALLFDATLFVPPKPWNSNEFKIEIADVHNSTKHRALIPVGIDLRPSACAHTMECLDKTQMLSKARHYEQGQEPRAYNLLVSVLNLLPDDTTFYVLSSFRGCVQIFVDTQVYLKGYKLVKLKWRQGNNRNDDREPWAFYTENHDFIKQTDKSLLESLYAKMHQMHDGPKTKAIKSSPQDEQIIAAGLNDKGKTHDPSITDSMDIEMEIEMKRHRMVTTSIHYLWSLLYMRQINNHGLSMQQVMSAIANPILVGDDFSGSLKYSPKIASTTLAQNSIVLEEEPSACFTLLWMRVIEQSKSLQDTGYTHSDIKARVELSSVPITCIKAEDTKRDYLSAQCHFLHSLTAIYTSQGVVMAREVCFLKPKSDPLIDCEYRSFVHVDCLSKNYEMCMSMMRGGMGHMLETSRFAKGPGIFELEISFKVPDDPHCPPIVLLFPRESNRKRVLRVATNDHLTTFLTCIFSEHTSEKMLQFIDANEQEFVNETEKHRDTSRSPSPMRNKNLVSTETICAQTGTFCIKEYKSEQERKEDLFKYAIHFSLYSRTTQLVLNPFYYKKSRSCVVFDVDPRKPNFARLLRNPYTDLVFKH